MAVQIFRLRGVPDDEADAVRQLLRAEQIDFYETPAGNWGISMPALWLRDEHELPRARALIDAYEKELAASARETYLAQRERGQIPSMAQQFLNDPIGIIAVAILVLAVLGLTVYPFLTFFR